MPANPPPAPRDDIEPWEQQPSESTQAFQAWVRYRDTTTRRSVHKVAAALAKSAPLVKRWSARWGWVERARLYDNHVDSEVRRDNEKRIIEFRRRAAQQARGKSQTLMLVDVGISQRLQQIEAAGGDILAALEGVSMAELFLLSTRGAQALPNLLRAEALALGDTTERTVDSLAAGTDDALTRRIRESDELRSLAATLVEKAGAAQQAPSTAPTPGPVAGS